MKTWTITKIKRAMKQNGSHWWDKQAMEYFQTRVESEVFSGPGGVYFVTSERPPNGKREYTVRWFNPDKVSIHSVDGFRDKTCEEATRIVSDLSK